jgi:hypothetical protein
MKFLEAIEKKFKLLEAGDITTPADPNAQQGSSPDAAMPGSAPQGAPEPPATPDQVDDMGENLQDQTNSTIKMCSDIVNALVVFMRGKFADQIAATPGLSDQLQYLERATTVTDVAKIDPKLLQSILTKVNEVKGL